MLLITQGKRTFLLDKMGKCSSWAQPKAALKIGHTVIESHPVMIKGHRDGGAWLVC
jgi:hypothetical protein